MDRIIYLTGWNFWIISFSLFFLLLKWKKKKKKFLSENLFFTFYINLYNHGNINTNKEIKGKI